MLQSCRFRLEELRLIYGKNLEIFLLNKLQKLGCLVAIFFKNRFAKVLTTGLIVANSIYLGSIRNLGLNSTEFLIGFVNFFSEKRIFSEFFESHLTFVSIEMIAVFLMNLFGVFSLWFCSKLLTKSHLASDKIVINLLLTCFACAFFLSGNLIQSNDILNASSIVIPCSFVVFCRFLVCKKTIKIRFGYELAVFVCAFFLSLLVLKPIFLNLFFFENQIKKISLWPFFWHNFLENFSEIFVEILLPILALISLNFRLIKSKFLLKNCLWLAIAGVFISVYLNGFYFAQNFIQKRIIYGLASPLIIITILEIFRHKFVNFRKNFLLILAVFLACFSNAEFLKTCLSLLVFFWFLLPMISLRKWQDFFRQDRSKHHLQKKVILFLCFGSALIGFLAIIFYSESLSLLIGGLMILCYLPAQQKLYELRKKSEFSSFSIFFLSLVVAGLTANFSQSFIRNGLEGKIAKNLENQGLAIAKNFQQFANQGQKILIISENQSDIEPIQSYLNGKNSSYSGTFDGYKNSDQLLSHIQNKELGMIIFFNKNPCKISPKERLFSNQNFQNIFNKNYTFLKLETAYEINSRPLNFFAQNFSGLTEEEKFALDDHGLISNWSYRFEIFVKKHKI